jgi:hypothetical protein
LINPLFNIIFLTSLFKLTSTLIRNNFQTKSKKFDAGVKFTEFKINIKNPNNDLTETRKWDWVSKYRDDDKIIYLLVNQQFSYRELLFV